MYLIEPVNEAPLSTMLRDSLGGYYDLCPEHPPIDSLDALVLGTGEAGASLDFRSTSPFYFVGVLFEPTMVVYKYRRERRLAVHRTKGRPR